MLSGGSPRVERIGVAAAALAAIFHSAAYPATAIALRSSARSRSPGSRGPWPYRSSSVWRRRGRSRVRPTPLASAVLAGLLLGERLSPPGRVGAALILIGIGGASGVVGRRRAAETEAVA